MNLLKKVIQLRESSHPDHEKPFLEHLEDLRVMITRIVITLLISMIVCFSFQKQLMEVLRRPVEQVWLRQVAAKLPQGEKDAPKPLEVEVWEEAKKVERAAAGLTGGERDLFFAAIPDQDLVFHAKSVALLRASLVLPEAGRDGFIAALDAPDDLKRQVSVLLKTAPNPDIDSRGNLRMMSALGPPETFMLSMKLSFFAGIIISFPLLLMYVLQFVLPGLHASEKRVMWPAMAVGFGLFLSGVFFSYFIVLPKALEFFSEWSGGLGVSNDWRIGKYISFATQFTLLFGLSFELPVVVMVFVKLGMLSYETMQKTRSYAVVAIFVAAAILTPTPDALTLSLMAMPMIVLYEICIWLAWFDRKKNREQEEQEAREREERIAMAGTAGAAAVVSDDDGGDGDQLDPWSKYDVDGDSGTEKDPEDVAEDGDEGWMDESELEDYYDESFDYEPYGGIVDPDGNRGTEDEEDGSAPGEEPAEESVEPGPVEEGEKADEKADEGADEKADEEERKDD
ncbi:MAG: twin-arginine translocase subunit TatC [Verrucomicrobiales bacterium]|nr:twin-arginine translocase subunit TatC [Verrucomicrobiota bacterium JB025]